MSTLLFRIILSVFLKDFASKFPLLCVRLVPDFFSKRYDIFAEWAQLHHAWWALVDFFPWQTLCAQSGTSRLDHIWMRSYREPALCSIEWNGHSSIQINDLQWLLADNSCGRPPSNSPWSSTAPSGKNYWKKMRQDIFWYFREGLDLLGVFGGGGIFGVR